MFKLNKEYIYIYFNLCYNIDSVTKNVYINNLKN